MLRVENIKKSFGGVHALLGTSFSVQENKITSLIGPNGAGKSTLFDCISGNVPPDQGNVLFKNKDITKKGIHMRARMGIARTFQQVRLFPNLTVEENLLLAPNQDDHKFFKQFIKQSEGEHNAINAILQKLGIENLDRQSRAANLSYGQQKLVGLARSLLFPHDLLLLDEPVAGVNPIIRNKLKTILLDLKKANETILLIEHDMNFVMSVSDHVIVMSEGSVLVEGPPNDIQNDSRVLDVYLGKSI